MARRELGPAALAVAQAVRSCLADVGGPVTVAVSGGADSLALAAGTAWVARRDGLAATGVVVDHQLQPGSAAVAARAAAQCRALGIGAVVETVTVTDGGEGPEAAARAARYAALERHPGPILLGHTLDDQAETVLLQLARGGGTRALAGMSPARGRLRRPLLGLRRATTAAACAQWGLEPWSDPHNADRRYARVRARVDALPALEAALGPGIAAALARTADQARADADHLDALAAAVELAPAPDVAALAAQPDAIRSRLLLRWLRARGAAPIAEHVAAVDRLVTAWHGQGPVDVPGGRVARLAGYLHWTPPDYHP